MAKFEILQSDKGTYYYHLRATGNHEIILHGTQYATKSDCRAAIDAVKANAPYDSRYERKDSVDGQYYFRLNNSAGTMAGMSEMYRSKASRDHGIDLVKAQAPDAPVSDLA
ncbi:YegP family protein [Taibaiella koreensis]|uniref:YegP family protein n=1 Tax=Taibaiella koreensis TaxID=1268548 RepID=UPI000E59E015|nr:YegP family protein [Taibaiella koreensis]